LRGLSLLYEPNSDQCPAERYDVHNQRGDSFVAVHSCHRF
jgi:hypothetical protein